MSLTIKNLSKQFDTILVLKNINLEIQQGEFLVLLGPSGCGKSTLLNCVAGLEAIEDEGCILINGQEVTDKAPKVHAYFFWIGIKSQTTLFSAKTTISLLIFFISSTM